MENKSLLQPTQGSVGFSHDQCHESLSSPEENGGWIIAWICDMEWTNDISYLALEDSLFQDVALAWAWTPKNSYGTFPGDCRRALEKATNGRSNLVTAPRRTCPDRPVGVCVGMPPQPGRKSCLPFRPPAPVPATWLTTVAVKDGHIYSIITPQWADRRSRSGGSNCGCQTTTACDAGSPI